MFIIYHIFILFQNVLQNFFCNEKMHISRPNFDFVAICFILFLRGFVYCDVNVIIDVIVVIVIKVVIVVKIETSQ